MKKLIILLLMFLPGYAGSAEPLTSKAPGLGGPSIGGPGISEGFAPKSLIAKYSYTYLPASTQTDDNGKPIQSASPLPLEDGELLHSGDYYNLQFTPKQACYVYIFQFDTSNKLFKLFPPEDFIGADDQTNPVKAQKTYFVPGKNKYFKLNDQTGPEKIHFLVSRTPNAELEEKYLAYLNAQITEKMQKQTDVTDLISKGPIPEVAIIDANSNMLQLECKKKNCVSNLTFKHQ